MYLNVDSHTVGVSLWSFIWSVLRAREKTHLKRMHSLQSELFMVRTKSFLDQTSLHTHSYMVKRLLMKIA